MQVNSWQTIAKVGIGLLPGNGSGRVPDLGISALPLTWQLNATCQRLIWSAPKWVCISKLSFLFLGRGHHVGLDGHCNWISWGPHVSVFNVPYDFAVIWWLQLRLAQNVQKRWSHSETWGIFPWYSLNILDFSFSMLDTNAYGLLKCIII